jgi:uncharacterized protein DUF5647
MARDDKELTQKALELSFEFTRLVLAQPELAKQIPENAIVAFEVDEDPELTAYSKKVSRAAREPDQPLVIVHVQRLAPSRLVQPELRPAA